MSSALVLVMASIFGILAVGVWGKIDKQVDKSWGADVTVFLLGAAFFCSVSGRWIPEGAGFLVLAVFTWVLTLGNIAFTRKQG